MSFIRVGGIALMSSLLLSACATPGMVNGGMIGAPWVNPWAPPPQPPVYAEPSVDVYKYQGSRQCESGGVSMASMQQQLQMAGVQIKGSSCGMDGLMYPAFCGGADGRINIFTIPASSVNAALGQGFSPLGNLQGAQRSSCASGGTSSSSYYDAGAPSITYPYNGSSGDASYYSY